MCEESRIKARRIVRFHLAYPHYAITQQAADSRPSKSEPDKAS